MKRWDALTNYSQIGVGTVFRILAVPQIMGHSPDVMQSGVELWIVRHDPQPIRSVVISASPAELVIQMDDGTRWSMTPVRADEHGSGITTRGMYAAKTGQSEKT